MFHQTVTVDRFLDRRKLKVHYTIVSQLVKRDLKLRYRGSVLGYIWSMLNPLLYMVVLSAVFSYIVRFEVEFYPLFLLSGILIWNFFQQSLSIGVASIVSNGSLLRKVLVPAYLFPCSNVASVFVNFILSVIPFMIVSIVIRREVAVTMFLIPFGMLLLAVFIYGLVLVLSSANVKYRDVSHLLDPLLTVMFYATPIIYPESAIPESAKLILKVNPMSYFLKLNRDIMFSGELPSLGTLLICTTLALFSLLVGIFTYNKMKDRFIYEL